ncbi:TPA: PH domain-containing protein [Candidatus Woesearchaeota archaeon]|nr:PH domain-containing protein [Candidatus Woesearchaeota archaeon]
MRELEKVIDHKEKILWEGQPKFWPFFFSRSFLLTIFGVFWSGILSIFVLFSFFGEGPLRYIIFLTPHFWVGIGMLIGPAMYNSLVYKHTYYAITDKRVIFQKGLIGRDFEIVDYDNMTNAEVNVGFFDKLFGGDTGSIILSTAGSFTYPRKNYMQRPYTISNIPNPYDVFKSLKVVSHDVKTDIQYPNKLRPKSNPGYNTKYAPSTPQSGKRQL